MVSAPYARKNGKNQLKLPFIPSRPTSRNQFCRSRGRSHKYIYLYPTRRRTARPANARTDTQDGRTDTQKHRPTRRWADGHAEARMQTQKHGRTRRSTDADAEARTQTQAPDGARTLNIYACSAWVEKSSRRVLRLDERTRTFEVYYIYIYIYIYKCTQYITFYIIHYRVIQ